MSSNQPSWCAVQESNLELPNRVNASTPNGLMRLKWAGRVPSHPLASRPHRSDPVDMDRSYAKGPRSVGAAAMIAVALIAVLRGETRAAPVAPTSHLAFDHAWIMVSPGAPERLALKRAGFEIAPGLNRNDGQGTA